MTNEEGCVRLVKFVGNTSKGPRPKAKVTLSIELSNRGNIAPFFSYQEGPGVVD